MLELQRELLQGQRPGRAAAGSMASGLPSSSRQMWTMWWVIVRSAGSRVRKRRTQARKSAVAL